MTSGTGSIDDGSANHLPSPAQLALALAVIRSKPPDMSIEGHIDTIRRAVKERVRNNSTVDYHFDACSYWRKLYEKSELERSHLLDEISELRHERDALQAQTKSTPALARHASRKRKSDATPASRKKLRFEKGNINAEDDSSEDDIEFEIQSYGSSDPIRRTLLRGFRSLRSALKLEEPDQDRLTRAVRLVTDTLCRSIQPGSSEGLQDDSLARDSPSIHHLCRTIRHIYPSILQGLDLIRPEKDDNGEQDLSAVSDVVRLFQTMLGCLHKCALDESSRREEEEKLRRKRRRSGTKQAKRTPTTSSPNYIDQAKHFTKTLVRMITDLDASIRNHCELLEGILCSLLDHIGSSLSLLVFGGSKQGDKDFGGIFPPRGLLDVSHLDLESATSSATIEGPYLISIMRRAADFVHQSTQRMPKESLLLFSVQEPNGTQAGGLRRLIEQTLQNTLLRGVYGDDDDTFYNALRRDEGADEDGNDLERVMEDMKQDEDGAEWFIGQLWEHLGWDILAGRRGT